MNIIVCYKIAAEEQDIVVRQDRTLSFERAEWKIGQYDLNAVEAGVKIIEEVGGKVSALSVGDKALDNSKLKKSILSRGPGDLSLVIDDSLKDADTYLTACALAGAARKIGFDLILCGEGSADLYNQQVGIQLGEMLGVPVVNAVSKIIPQGESIIVERNLEDEVEVLEIPLPAVVSVSSDINVSRIPGMKEILGASKKPVVIWNLKEVEVVDDGQRLKIESVLAPEQMDRKKIILESDSEENIASFCEYIRKELR